ncbi:MAG: DegV family protein [Clostridia bacterium]|nr:DegV family protein [Clostridia bacterium]
MVQISTDTSCMMTPAQGAEKGIGVAPLNVTIAGETYREMDEIMPKEFVKIIYAGNLPTSSQPSPGALIEFFEKATEKDPLLHISMADGLSGSYQSACAVRETMPNKDYITVINSATLCGPHGLMVRTAKKLADEGKSIEEILEKLQIQMENNKSFLIPQDFDYLRRGGRLSPTAAKVGGLLKLVPVMTQGEGGKNLEKAAMCRNFDKAIEKCIETFQRLNVNEEYLITISHADTVEQARHAQAMLSKAFPGAAFELVDLTCAFVTQGGPKCVAVQACKRV